MNMYPWQQQIFDQITSSGIKPKELICMTAGRGVGKSAFSAQALKRIMDDINNRPIEDLILTENKISGARYYCVEPVGGNWREMELWVTETCGAPGEIWPKEDFVWPEMPRWVMNNRKFWFRNEADRTMFVMKWR
jgi:hypothetical protein